MASGQRHRGTDHRAVAGLGVDHQRAAEHFGALAHADEAEWPKREKRRPPPQSNQAHSPATRSQTVVAGHRLKHRYHKM
jgi:hypothetical protein